MSRNGSCMDEIHFAFGRMAVLDNDVVINDPKRSSLLSTKVSSTSEVLCISHYHDLCAWDCRGSAHDDRGARSDDGV
jgi:hypothetical protein